MRCPFATPCGFRTSKKYSWGLSHKSWIASPSDKNTPETGFTPGVASRGVLRDRKHPGGFAQVRCLDPEHAAVAA